MSHRTVRTYMLIDGQAETTQMTCGYGTHAKRVQKRDRCSDAVFMNHPTAKVSFFTDLVVAWRILSWWWVNLPVSKKCLLFFFPSWIVSPCCDALFDNMNSNGLMFSFIALWDTRWVAYFIVGVNGTRGNGASVSFFTTHYPSDFFVFLYKTAHVAR